MSDQDETPEPEAPQEEPKQGAHAGKAGGGSAGKAGSSGPAQPDEEGDGQPEQPEANPFDQAGRNPLGGSGGSGGIGGAGTAHAARLAFAAGHAGRAVGFGADGQYFEGNTFISQYGAGGGPAMVQGPVHAEELARLDEIYCQTDGYRHMKDRLRERGLLVLCGEPGSGRTATALALLAELTENRVIRLDPSSRVHEITAVTEGHGHLLEIEDDDGPGQETEPAEGRGRARVRAPVLTELHLDRFRGLLAGSGAYGVVLVESGDLADRLLRGRYGVACPSPPSGQVLRRHLEVLLRDAPETALDEARALAGRDDVKAALGLRELRPGEAARFAELLARRLRGELTHGQLLDECTTFVRAQARAWFAGADRPGTLPEALPTLSAAAFRIAVAVFHGSSYSLTAEAGEQLAWELAVTLDPGTAVGRRLFGTHAEARPAVARSVLGDGELDLGDAKIPVRAIGFQGDALATAVLREVWLGHHNARGPVVRWLRALCDDPRPVLWVRASIAAGVLCSWDLAYGVGEMIDPMAASDSAVQQMSAATALAEASREPSARSGVRSLLKSWAKSDSAELRTAAVLAHGYGMAAGSVTASLDALGKAVRLGEDDEDDDRGTDLLADASFSVTRLLAGPEPETVLRRLEDWLHDGRRPTVTLALLAVIGALRTRTTYLWGLQDVPELDGQGDRMLATGLLTVRPELTGPLAALVRRALATARSGSVAQDALAALLRQAADEYEKNRSGDGDRRDRGDGQDHRAGHGNTRDHGDPRDGEAGRAGRDGEAGRDGDDSLWTVCRFLSRLAVGRRDRDRLRHLLARLVRDPDEPLDKDVARRMWDAVGEGAER
ncbi:nSTAND3 domain-containing NTPase [Streptomyces sp. NPDC004749]